jgi:nitroreductase
MNMDLFQAIAARRSIRKYRDIPVEAEKLRQVLDAARLAPSWKNLQCWRFLVIANAQTKARILAAFPEDNPGRKALAQAPLLILVCAAPEESGVENGIEYYIADSAIAFEHLCLAAQALGLGTCWMGWYDEAQLKVAAGVPEPFRVVGVTPLGYPDQEPKARPRKELQEVAYFDQWGESAW